jgi:hypothetical protein
MERINMAGAVLCGVIVFIFSLLAVMESVLRKFFASRRSGRVQHAGHIHLGGLPGLLLAFQEPGTLPSIWSATWLTGIRKAGQLPRRIMSVIGYICAFIVVAVILWGGWIKTASAIKANEMWPFVFKFPMVVSTLPVVIGSVQMLATLTFIILDLIAGGDKYM